MFLKTGFLVARNIEELGACVVADGSTAVTRNFVPLAARKSFTLMNYYLYLDVNFVNMNRLSLGIIVLMNVTRRKSKKITSLMRV